mmetsp:Transcript_23510/g.76618  ORF Transcript_23510/g.76618 Transcript_23510/m.76618 type:complete len:212 (-) Transcript_23510:268-903(-)
MERTSITVPKPPKRNVIRIKIISMGDAGCGKSCLIKRYCEEKFVSKYISTIGVDYGVKSVVVSNQQVKANFWDLAGGPEYFDVRNEFYRDAQGAILVFDVSNRASFEALEGWVQEAYKHGAKDMQVAVCGNKVGGNTCRPILHAPSSLLLPPSFILHPSSFPSHSLLLSTPLPSAKFSVSFLVLPFLTCHGNSLSSSSLTFVGSATARAEK